MPNNDLFDEYARAIWRAREIAHLKELIETRELANPESLGDAITTRAGDSVPPRVSGLELAQSSWVGALRVKWAPSPIRDLRRYEVQVATDVNFTQIVDTFSTRRTNYEYTEGAPLTTYYVRVRAINANNRAGAWSPTLNTRTGQAISADLASVSVTNWERTVYTGPPLQLNSATPSQELLETTLQTKGGLVMGFYNATIEATVAGGLSRGDILKLDFFEDTTKTIDGEVILSSTNNPAPTFKVSQSGSILSAPPTAGSHTYKIRIFLEAPIFGSILQIPEAHLLIVEIGREGLS